MVYVRMRWVCGLLDAWISQLYIARRSRGLQSKNPWEMASRTDFIASPVSRLSSSSPVVVTVTSSRNTAIPCIGSLQSGPWAVASWNACDILSEKSRTVKCCCFISESVGLEAAGCLVSSRRLHFIDIGLGPGRYTKGWLND